MVLAESKLRVGVIYGDPENNEYVYMPGSELGVKDPLCVYEAEGLREDVDMHEALRLIRQAAKAEDPEAVVLGEVWEDAVIKSSYGYRRKYALGESLDSVMNYPFRSAS